MNVRTNIPLSTLTTMRLGGNANYVVEVTSNEELQQLYQNSKKLNQPVYIIGSGSNLIAHDEGFPGIIILMRIMGIEVLEDTSTNITIAAGGGELWDDLVKNTVERSLTGIEAMSGIPGTVGAAPVQNIGAYGQEVADTFVSLEAYDTETDSFVIMDRDHCEFSYRHSVFRGSAQGRYIITRITLSLYKSRPEPPFYDSLQKYLETHEIGTMNVTPKIIRDAVLEIRADKLPDPNILANSGSFFKNAIVEQWKADDLLKSYPEMPTYPFSDGLVKIPAGWLIDYANLKGETLHGIKVHDGNAVVLINESATCYADLNAARREIIDTISNTYQIILEQEPLEI